MTCLICGGSLQQVSLPGAAPWLCSTCHRGWWNAELTTEARQAYQREYGVFHRKSGVRNGVIAEAQVAHRRLKTGMK